MSIAYLDTHVAVFLHDGLIEEFSMEARHQLEANDVNMGNSHYRRWNQPCESLLRRHKMDGSVEMSKKCERLEGTRMGISPLKNSKATDLCATQKRAHVFTATCGLMKARRAC